MGPVFRAVSALGRSAGDLASIRVLPDIQIPMSLLPELTSLAGIILAFNIAYLRLDQFRHQERVRQYAREKLKEIVEAREVPSTAARSESYSALVNLAEDPRGKIGELTRFWSWTYAVFLRTRIDRGLSLILAAVGLAVVCVGNAHAVDQWQGLAPLFAAERISWSLYGLVACAVLSVLFAILGEWVVRGTWKNIDRYASEPMNLMRKTAASTKVENGDWKDGSWY